MKMLEDLAEVVAEITPRSPGGPWVAANFIRTHHAEIAQNAEAAKRLVAVERDAARWRYLVSENNKGMHGKYRICWLDPRRDGFITTDGVSCDGKDEQAIVRIIDAAMGERHGTR